MIWKRIIITAILAPGMLLTARGQILDDSTKQIYGPSTTEYTLEDHIKFNDPKIYPIDTLLDNNHRFNFVSRTGYKMQDLGNIGTSMRPLYYEMPEQIGLGSGFNSFDPYFIKPSEIRYYNTRSPYTKLSAVFGGNGRSLVDVSFSRSDSTKLNLGFDFRRITADKQVGSALSRGDRNVLSTAYDIYARWHPGNYQLLLNFSRMNHQQFESGGLIPLASGSLDHLFIADSAVVWLNNALSEETRNNWHIFQQFQISELLQVYHQLDHTLQKIRFGVTSLTQDGAFFDQILINDSETSDATTTETLRNELGVKGMHRGIFYNFFLSRRDIRYRPKYLGSNGFQTELYLGANLRYRLGSQTLKFQGLVQDGGSYRLAGIFQNKFIEASYTRVQYNPSLLQTDYFGNHGEWHNSFSSPTADALKGTLKIETPTLNFQPSLTLTNVNNPVYFNQLKTPEQASGAAQILSPEVAVKWRFLSRLTLQGQITYATVTGNARDVFRVPNWLIVTQIAYTNNIFNDKLEAQFGLDTQYRSAFFGYDYEPSIQQFFLQDTFEVPQYFLGDFFINFRVGRALIFAKLVFINEGLGRPGYFTAPYYPGQGRVFDWGFTWQFFD